MEHADYATTRSIEGHNWWFVGMRRICLELRDRASQHPAARASSSTVLDVGCGTGINLEHVGIGGAVVGLDRSSTALGFCTGRELGPLLQGDAVALPVGDRTVGLVTAIGVVEHLEDDEGAIREWARVLEPGGRLVLLTSAYSWMWSGHDVSNHHVRRYRVAEVEALLVGAGLVPIQVSYVNGLLFGPIALVRVVERIRRRGRPPVARKDTGEVPGPANRLLIGLLAIEAFLLRRGNLPVGVSIVASAVRPER